MAFTLAFHVMREKTRDIYLQLCMQRRYLLITLYNAVIAREIKENQARVSANASCTRLARVLRGSTSSVFDRVIVYIRLMNII